MMETTAELKERIRARGLEIGFHVVGFAPARPGPHSQYLDEWLARGHAGEMHYLERTDDRRKDPRRVLPGARSVVVCAASYLAPDATDAREDPTRGRVARYARGRDYHDVLRADLLALLDFIRAEAPEPVEARAYVDTGPVLEREVAALAGIGQFGKNTMLISRSLGSYFLIGVIVSTLALEPDPPAVKDICGRCTRCLDACPTSAFVRPFDLDARRCISYLTIELRGPIPADFRPDMGNWVFGCDVCQDVCPWNRRANPVAHAGLAPEPGAGEPPLLELLRLSQEEFSARFRGSPVKRAKRRGLLRNVAVALGNARDPDAVPALADALHDPEPLVRGHAAWALGRIGTPAAAAALEAAAARERDPGVLEEIRAAQQGQALVAQQPPERPTGAGGVPQ